MFLETKREGEAKTVEPWRQLLLDAADYMEKHGHAKFAQVAPNGAVCLHGAMNQVEGTTRRIIETELHRESTAHLRTFLRVPDLGIWHLADWNNEPGRAGHEVIAAMRACATS